MRHFPADWPGPGAIDLSVHDKPHVSSSIEWWYLNCHLLTGTNRDLSIFAAFFRICLGYDEKTKIPRYAYSITWALSDAQDKRYFAESLLDKNAPQIGLEKMERGEGTRDPRLRQAMREVLEKGKIPRPDKMFKNEPNMAFSNLDINFDDNCLTRSDDGTYLLRLISEDNEIDCHLAFKPEKEPVRHGVDGVVKGVDNADMFYYFIPRCAVSGHLNLYGKDLDVASGSGWYDHEFGIPNQDDPAGSQQPDEVAWNWAAIQLEDGSEITAYNMQEVETGKTIGQRAIHVHPNGSADYYDDVVFEPLEAWRSKRTFNDYPTFWKLEIPQMGLTGHVGAQFDDQEFITAISKPSFWEGRVQFSGRKDNQDVNGIGYVERSGYATVETLDDFFSAVGEVVVASVQDLLPFEPTRERVRDLIGTEERDHYMDGIHIPQFVDSLIRPLREIADRGGKSWRSYAALASCDVVGGDSRRFVQWLAMPELMHVGSLIVDDVEDGSDVRRGGPTCHIIYGEPLAINAGTAGYFLGHKLLHDSQVSDRDKLRLYDLYFEVLRAAHGGQAIDIDGLNMFMPDVVETGDGEMLERRVLAIHRLKTAVPAGVLSRMGAVVGGGTEEQIEAVGAYMEAIGVAFQIIDDVLDIRGFSKKLKKRGGDIRQGKVTLPLAKAMQRLPELERRWLWDTLESKPTDDKTVSAVIEMLESCGAVEECVTQADQVVESAWQRFDEVIEDSFVKLMLRAFGWYVLKRHY